MIKSSRAAFAGALALCFAGVCTTPEVEAQDATYALYCRGPLNTFRTDGGKVIRTPFKWAKDAASKENPGPGECGFAEHRPDGLESKAGESSSMIGNIGPFDSLPAGTFGKLCVTKPGGAGPNELAVREIVRQLGHELAPFHRPPFSAAGCSS